jgi:hypothetical protein
MSSSSSLPDPRKEVQPEEVPRTRHSCSMNGSPSRKDTTVKRKLISGFALSMRRGYRVALATVVLVTVLVLGAFTHAPAAHAGTNGQQLEITTNSNSVLIVGYNQNHKPALQCFLTPAVPPVINYDTNWWWETWNGVPVTLTFYNSTNCTGQPKGSVSIDVPISQPADWVQVTAY